MIKSIKALFATADTKLKLATESTLSNHERLQDAALKVVDAISTLSKEYASRTSLEKTLNDGIVEYQDKLDANTNDIKHLLKENKPVSETRYVMGAQLEAIIKQRIKQAQDNTASLPLIKLKIAELQEKLNELTMQVELSKMTNMLETEFNIKQDSQLSADKLLIDITASINKGEVMNGEVATMTIDVNKYKQQFES